MCGQQFWVLLTILGPLSNQNKVITGLWSRAIQIAACGFDKGRKIKRTREPTGKRKKIVVTAHYSSSRFSHKLWEDANELSKSGGHPTWRIQFNAKLFSSAMSRHGQLSRNLQRRFYGGQPATAVFVSNAHDSRLCWLRDFRCWRASTAGFCGWTILNRETARNHALHKPNDTAVHFFFVWTKIWKKSPFVQL